ncbi:type II secretion system protein GspD [Ohtaekwangia koreensis]|uniref:Type IV pilus assembly protein PilQ n=1 Tax=Ohtaekwangia koreensis TaxID=688867 RepID=A0A1T5K699_9BACT|nr:type II and III secretion system protein [Ohtaekwangia koreensis]SKC59267.1 type IV pilus assembly protein PilQ [Ohtaekwangia koreensis]
MNNIRLIVACLLFFGVLSAGQVYAQDTDPFLQRLEDIKIHLDFLSDSLAPGLNESANFSVAGLSLQIFLRTLAESHDLNIQVDPSINVTLANNFTSVRVKEIIYFLCQEYQLDIRFINSIMSFNKYIAPKIPLPKQTVKKLKIQYDPSLRRVSFDLLNDSLRAVVKEITRISDRNVVVSGGAEVENRLVTGYIRDLTLESALDKLAYTNGLRLIKTKDDVFILEANQPAISAVNFNSSSNNNALSAQRISAQGDILVKDSLITLDVVNFPILEVINQVSTQLGVDYIMFSEITGNTTAKVKRARYSEMLSFLFQGTNYTFKKREGVYLIGQRNQEGFRVSELIKLDFRTIEGVEKEIPSDMIKEVEIKILKELNSFILTGNKQKIDELVSFIKLIDQPIPNILIEVIVAEAQKSFSLQTGIKAFISSDSVPNTSGQIFPGLDLTLSSKSVNSILEKLDTKGIVNLGRVSPNFYTTLQALETNNNIQIRSTPKLSTMNGSKANLTIGESQYYVEQTQNITGGVTPITSTTQRFNKVEANLAITISPVVSGNEHITLDILAEFSNFSAPTVQNAPPGNKTRKFESKIRVKNEEVIILGGLEQLSKTEGGSGVPLLSRIPVLKWFFSSKTKKKEDNRLIVFIKPTLVY